MDQVVIHLFHGRKSPSKDMDDHGTEGPWLGPFDYVHFTYMSDIKIANNNHGESFDDRLRIHEGLIYYDGVFYGDFSVNSTMYGHEPEIPTAHKLHLPPMAVMRCCMCSTRQVQVGAGARLECITDGCDSAVFQQVSKLEEPANEASGD